MVSEFNLALPSMRALTLQAEESMSELLQLASISPPSVGGLT